MIKLILWHVSHLFHIDTDFACNINKHTGGRSVGYIDNTTAGENKDPRDKGTVAETQISRAWHGPATEHIHPHWTDCSLIKGQRVIIRETTKNDDKSLGGDYPDGVPQEARSSTSQVLKIPTNNSSINAPYVISGILTN